MTRIRTNPIQALKRGGLVLFFCLFATVSAFAANTPPSPGTINPGFGSSPVGTQKSFTTTYTDLDTWQDIGSAYLLINANAGGANCAFTYYDNNTNKLYLRNNANTAWLGGFAPGSSNIIDDLSSKAKLHCAQTTVTGQGNTLTITWAITFKSGFINTKNTYLFVKDKAGTYSVPFTKKGTWTINNQPPQLGAITPASGSSTQNQEVLFTTTFTDPNGFQDLHWNYFKVKHTPDGGNCPFFLYDSNNDRLYIRNDANTQWLGGFTPGSSNIIENSFAKLDCFKTSVSGSANTLTLTWALTFKSSFTGTKNTYINTTDDTNANTGWVDKGVWNIILDTAKPNIIITSPQEGQIFR